MWWEEITSCMHDEWEHTYYRKRVTASLKDWIEENKELIGVLYQHETKHTKEEMKSEEDQYRIHFQKESLTRQKPT